jgi:hypothetical protein
MVWVRERTIPTERPPLVSEVIANFCGYRVPRDQRDGFLRPYSRFSRQEPLLFYQIAPQLYSRGWVDPVADSLLFFSGSVGNRTRASGSVAKNSDHQTTEAVQKLNTCINIHHRCKFLDEIVTLLGIIILIAAAALVASHSATFINHAFSFPILSGLERNLTIWLQRTLWVILFVWKKKIFEASGVSKCQNVISAADQV